MTDDQDLQNSKSHSVFLAEYTTFELSHFLSNSDTAVILLPVGSVEPHGPHLSLETDTLISQISAKAAVGKLNDSGVQALIAPAIPYGVTNCAAQFKGAITVEAEALTTFLSSVVKGLLANGFCHICLINNHLEPEQDQSVRAVLDNFDETRVSVASPLTRRWARTLTTEFKRGECHAGQYETSIILAGAKESVRQNLLETLKPVPISLSEKLKSGISDFGEMGMDQAYAGSPVDASVTEGNETIEKLSEMVATEVLESISRMRSK